MDFRGLFEEVDSEWRATKQKPSRFSFSTSDFNDINKNKYKATIRAIFYETWFPGINIKDARHKPYSITVDSLNKCIKAFKNVDKSRKFDLLFDYTLKGLGAGEVLLYLIIDDSYIMGGSSAAIDLTARGIEFEIKSAMFNQGSKFYYDFSFGGTIIDDTIKDALFELAKNTEGSGISQNAIVSKSLAIPPTSMRKIESANKKEFKDIEERYCEIVKSYLGNTHLVLFDRRTGFIEFLKKGSSIVEGDIGIYRIARGAIEPRIFFKK